MAIVHTVLDLSPLRLSGSDALRLNGGAWSTIAQAVVISLLSWRRAEPDDQVPNDGEREGWWADAYLDEGDAWGSRLWLLQRSPLTDGALADARAYALEALRWMLDDDVAARVDVEAQRHGVDRLSITATIHRRDGEREAVRFPDLWSVING